MKTSFVFIILMLWVINIRSQTIPVELMVGNKFILYQHNISKNLNTKGNFGWTHIANFMLRYNTNKEDGGLPNEMMNQAYITFKPHRYFKVFGGLFYTQVSDFKPSMGFQFAYHKPRWTLILTPRMNVQKPQNYELFALFEFKPKITKKVAFYSRFQMMTNHTIAHHNRSYQQLRLGIEMKNTQFGLGINIDEYGAEVKVYQNVGVFVRKTLF